MPIISCSVTGCGWESQDLADAIERVAVLTNHSINHNLAHAPATATPTPAAAASSRRRGPKLTRPEIDFGVSAEEWNAFVRRWNIFCDGSDFDDAAAPSQLFQCASSALGDAVLKSNPDITSRPIDEALSSLRSLAIVPVAIGVLRAELMCLKQERDEPFRAFAARVRGKAETCAYTIMCTCGVTNSYTDDIIKDVLMAGIADSDIRNETLGSDQLVGKSVNDVVAIVERREMARNSYPVPSLSAISSFKKSKIPSPPSPAPAAQPSPKNHIEPTTADRNKTASCPTCRKTFRLYEEKAWGWNSRPHKMCLDCHKNQRRRGRASTNAVEDHSAQSQEPNVSQIATNTADRMHSSEFSGRAPIQLGHHVFTKNGWRQQRMKDHPRVPLSISIDDGDPQRSSGLAEPAHSAETLGIVDSGAQSNLWSLKEFDRLGFDRSALSPVTMTLSAANKSPIPIEGAFFAKLKGLSEKGNTVESRAMICVSSAANGLYLSLEAMLDLGIVSHDFPSIGAAWRNDQSEHEGLPPQTGISDPSSPPIGPSINVVREANAGCSTAPMDESGRCSCPMRTAVPARPKRLPFECKPENNDRMKAWLIEYYGSSTFNTCPHRPLAAMAGPPVEIHLDPSAIPRACHTPANVPLHWQEAVHNDLLRDEALGVIEPVPYGEVTDWCHRMVVTRKHDGSPRRTVDLSPLNKFCKRETFATESPFVLARRIPKGTWKTVSDAWNGYHSVPLRESDRHLTSFITPFGKWRYLRTPQGFVSSGDGYNRRFDAILSDFERKERCVDDTVHYDEDLECHWWRTIDFLSTVGQSGVVLNPSKFQFAQKEVDFAGFRVSDSSIEPLPKFLDAIREFPTPTSTTDIRSWFGLVNQVASYAQLRDTMAPFKPFLSPKVKFYWNEELEGAFQASKVVIVEAIRQGVQIFDMRLPTCLRPDWSCRGIGYFLSQKHCGCEPVTPDCCQDGWKVTLAGSRFLSPAESRYAPIEGEALAVAWGLEQSRYFTQGCDKLTVVTDHKPLVKIFGDRTLDEIANPRLFRLK